jgi:redox-sensitive bicupin YhaK (pirin superfamily)
MALPESQQEIDPAFVHYPGNSLPRFETPGATTTVVIGEYGGVSSPVELCARTLYLSLELAAGTAYPLESCEEQLAVYLVSGAVRIGEKALEPGEMAVLSSGAVDIRAESESRAVVIGGENLGPRRMFWNFVHTSQQRIEQAKQDWLDGNFDMVPGDDEFIPLP